MPFGAARLQLPGLCPKFWESTGRGLDVSHLGGRDGTSPFGRCTRGIGVPRPGTGLSFPVKLGARDPSGDSPSCEPWVAHLCGALLI